MAKRRRKTKTVLGEREGKPSASMLYRLRLCPGSPTTSEESFSTEEDRKMAESGDRVHLEMQFPGMVELSQDEKDVADMLLKKKEHLIENVFGDSGPSVELMEKRIWSSDRSFSAQVDYAAHDETVGLVINYKSGWGKHDDAPVNLQIGAEASLFLLDTTLSGTARECYAAVVQPGKAPELVRFSIEDAGHTVRAIEAMIGESEKPNAPRIPSPKACRWCPSKLNCKELREVIDEAAKWRVKEGMKPEDLAEILNKMGAAEAAIRTARGLAKSYITAGESVPGWRLSDPKEVTSYPDTKGAFDLLYEAGMVDAESMLKCVNIDANALISQVAERQEIPKAEAKRQIRRLLTPVEKKTARRPSLENA